MDKACRILMFWILLAGCWGCAEEGLVVLEEGVDLPLLFQSVEVEKVRRGAEIGMRVRARVKGYGGGSPNAYVRGRVLGSDGKVLEGTSFQPTHHLRAREDSLGGSIDFQDTLVFVQGEVAQLSKISREDGGLVELFFPYQWWRGERGKMDYQVELEALEGVLPGNWLEDIPHALQAGVEHERVGYLRFVAPLPYPDLHTAQVWVQYLVMDTTAFNPHESDVSLFHLKDTYGFPDLFWNVGMDYEEVYRSPYYKNSVSALWEEPSSPFFIDGFDADLQLCVYDWDDETWFNNQDDALSCWDGRLSDLSQDARKPTRLSFDLVAEMGVVLQLDGQDPWAASKVD